MAARTTEKTRRPLAGLALVIGLYDWVFGTIRRGLEGWFLGLFARFVFAAVLLVYFYSSAMTKVGVGFAGFFSVKDAAYFQIVPKVVERYDYDASKVPFIYDLIVVIGTYGEFFLPILIVAGLFTRIAAIGMIAFVAIQTYVDIADHGVDGSTIGALFDGNPGAVIADQRLLWGLLLVYLVIRGAGMVSLDYVLVRLRGVLGLAASRGSAH